nr:elongation factor G [Roseburia sp. AM51-8]
MKVFTTDKIRNVVVLGHSGAGKTSLVSAMNGIATASKQRMTEPAATTQMLVQPILWDDHKINILDVPGAFDFVGEIEEAVGVADAAIIVISGKNGVENGTRKAWAMCEKYHLPRIVYVSDMDIDDVSFKNVVLGLQELYGKCIAPFHFPLRENEEFVGYVNVIQERAKRWQSDGTVVKSEVPEYSMENLSIYREALMEAVAETSEEFLDRYFAGETFSENEIRQALRVNVSEGTIVPVMMGSNTMERGMYTLLADIIKYLPSPDQRSATGMNVLTQELFEANYNFAKAKTAYVFKTIMDPFIGKYSLFKVMSGVIKSDDNLYDPVKGQEIRISKLYVMKGSKAEEVEELHAGDVGALSKVSGLQTSTTLSTKATPVLYPATAISTPYCAMRYFAADAKEDDKLTQSLLKLAEEDRTLRVENDSENRQTLVYGISEQHLQAVADRLRAKYNVEMQLEAPKVAYRETIRGSADVEYKHKKQSGGHGQYGHVKIKVSPSEDLTSAYEFEETVVGGAIPKNFFPAVEKGIAEGTQAGPLAGYPVVGIHVNLYDGSSHSVDSSEAAFKTAATMALKDAS